MLRNDNQLQSIALSYLLAYTEVRKIIHIASNAIDISEENYLARTSTFVRYIDESVISNSEFYTGFLIKLAKKIRYNDGL